MPINFFEFKTIGFVTPGIQIILIAGFFVWGTLLHYRLPILMLTYSTIIAVAVSSALFEIQGHPACRVPLYFIEVY